MHSTDQSPSIIFFFSLDSFPSVCCKVGTKESYNISMECPEQFFYSVSQLFKVINPLINLLKVIDRLSQEKCIPQIDHVSIHRPPQFTQPAS